MNEYNYNQNPVEELDWDSEISKESSFIEVKPGEYDFTVVSFERGYHNGSEKLPACPKATLHLELDTPEGKAPVTHNLFISRRTEGLLCEFFLCIGQKKHGEPLRMDWSKVTGSRGRCKVGTREYNGNTYADVKKFLEPKAAPSGGVPAYRAPGSRV